MKNVMKKAHEITKKIIRKGDSYRATFRLALSLAHSLIKKGVKVMVELVGTEKQVKWATDIREIMLECLNKSLKFQEEEAKSSEARRGKPSKILNRRVETLKNYIEMVKNQESSVWFIENFKYATHLDRDTVKNCLYEAIFYGK